MDYCSYVLDAMAIGISIFSLIKSNSTEKKQRKIKLRENYYEPVFKEMMTKEYPRVFNNFIDIKNNKVSKDNSNDFEKIISNFRKNIRYMMFTDDDIYKVIDDILIEIDEKIVILSTREENKEENIKKICELSNNLYKNINKYFSDC